MAAGLYSPAVPEPLVAILIVSDRRAAGAPDATAGPLSQRLEAILGPCKVERQIVADDRSEVAAAIVAWCDRGARLVLTSGGTGFGPRDVTPEATRDVLDRPAPGLVVALIAGGLARTPHAMLGRPEAGLREGTLIVNLPGSPTGALEALETLAPALPHALEVLAAEPGAEARHGAPDRPPD
jgi:molybdenum cofactor synthesis domain-containing protein